MKYHQGIRAEIETRSKNFNACLELSESLLQRQHQDSEEVRGTVGQRWPPPCPCSHSCQDKTASWERSSEEARLSLLQGVLGMRAPPHPFKGMAAGRESRLITHPMPTF